MSNLFSLLWSRVDLASEELRSERRLVVRAGSLYSVVVSSSSRIATNVTLDARTFSVVSASVVGPSETFRSCRPPDGPENGPNRPGRGLPETKMSPI